MKIIELQVEGIKRIRAVTIRPDGSLVEVTGANGEGKTSTLDAMWMAFKGRCGVIEPVRRGEERGHIKVTCGNDAGETKLVVTRTFRRDKQGDVTMDLKVVQADGAEVRRSPQAMLDALVGSMSFDPLEFSRMGPKDQFGVLSAFVTGFDFDANASERKRLYDERTAVNRRTHAAEASIQTAGFPPGPKPKPVDVSAAVDELQKGAEANARVTSAARQRLESRNQVERWRDEAEQLRARAATIDKRANSEETILAALAPLPDMKDLIALRAEIARAEDVKNIIAVHERREHKQAEASAARSESETITREIEALDAAKRNAIAAASMPVPELTLGDGVVLYKGIPFADASHAEKLVVSASVAMAENPELRVIRCYEGSNLDRKSLGILAAMAESRQYQVWIEKVDETGEVGFVIEDGELKS